MTTTTYLCFQCMQLCSKLKPCKCVLIQPKKQPKKQPRKPRYTYEIRLWTGLDDVRHYDVNNDGIESALSDYRDAVAEHRTKPVQYRDGYECYPPYFDVKKYDRDGDYIDVDLNDSEQLGKRVQKFTFKLHDLIQEIDISDIEKYYQDLSGEYK